MPVYLLHFSEPYQHARHYIGFSHTTRTLKARLAHHASGTGAKLMRAVGRAGIEWSLARTWKDGDRTFERQLKNRKNSSLLCPICSGRKANSRAAEVQG